MPGIDSLIQSRSDAYRQNPQQLQQRYQGNKQLIDLLALQKIKSEKEETARQMQMQMDQDPSTIAAQREQEVMGLTKNEMSQQTGALLEKKQGDEQRNMKELVAKMGQQGQPSQGPGQPVAPPAPTPGIAANPAPNMQKFSQGGIVGFNEQGSVDDAANATLQKEIARLKEMYKGARLSDERLLAMAKKNLNDPSAVKDVVGAVNKAAAPFRRGDGLDSAISKGQGASAESMYSDILAPQPRPTLGAEQGPQLPPAGIPGLAESISGRQAPGLNTSVSYERPNTPPAESLQGPTAPTPVTASADLRQGGLNSLIEGQTSRDPGVEGIDARNEAAKFMGRGAKNDKYSAMEAEQKAMMEGINDPSKRRTERIAATLAGAGGRSYTMGQGMHAAGSAERQRQEGESKSMLADLNKSRVAAMNSDLGISQSAIGEGAAVRGEANEGITSGITNLTNDINNKNTNATQLAGVNARAQAAFDQTIAAVESANITAGARDRATKVNKEMRTLMAAAVAAGSKAETLTKVNEIVSKVTESWNLGAAMRPTAQKISALEKQLTDGDGNTKENVDALKLLKAKDQAELRATYEPLFLYHESLGGQASKKPETPSPAGSGAFKSPTGITSTILPTPGA
jgi:hypothetical protein